MKKILSVLMAVALLTAVIPLGTFTASAETVSGSCGTNVTWSYNTSTYTLTISGTGAMSDYNYSSYNGTYVTTAPWKQYYSTIEKVVINSGVTTIGEYVFYGCTALMSIIISDSVISIGSDAFRGCTGITSITIPDLVTSVGEYAFYGCSGLTYITIPDSVVSIGNGAFIGTAWYNNQSDGLVYAGKVVYRYHGTCPSNVIIKDGTLGIAEYAFRGCTGLTEITIPDSVTSVDDGTFEGCTGLTSVTIGNSVTSIGRYAFDGCTGLTAVTIPDSVTSIGRAAFCGCTGLTSVTIGNSVTSIGAYAFSRCNGLTSITIPNSVKGIGSHAFSYCTGLTSITIPDSVTAIYGWAFYSCTGLTSITIPDSVTSFENSAFDGCQIKNLIISEGSKTITSTMVVCKSTLENITIPDSVTSIDSYAFRNCRIKNLIISEGSKTVTSTMVICKSTLESITIPNSVTSIGDSAFNGCTRLTSIVIPDSVTSIGDSAFNGCTGLTSIVIPDSVTSIGDSSFSGCTGITSMIIPRSVTSIGISAFSGCSSLEEIALPFVGEKRYTAIGADQYPFGYIFGALSYTGGTATTQVHRGSNSIIGSSTYYIPSSLKKVTVTDCEYIQYGAFYNCSGFTSITIPNGITTIDQVAFYGCTGLTSIVIPDSVTSIGYSAFSGCAGLESIPVTSSNYFYHSSGYCLIETESKTLIAGCKNSKIPTDGSVTSIGWSAFSGCTGLTSITIPDSVTSIGYSAFSGCAGLTSITIPDSVTSIGYGVFRGCTGLTSITIPDSVTSIGNLAFDGCTELTSIIIPRSINTVGNNSIPKDTRIFCYKDSAAESYAKNNKNVYYIISDNGKCGESSEYYILGDKLYIIGTGETDSWKTQGGVPWYDLAAQIKEVIIDEGITKIGTYAFYCLDNLESVICKNEDLEFSRYALNTTNENLTVYSKNGALTEYCGNNGIRFIDVTATPELVEVTANSITVKTVSGYEYSKDKEKWQTSGVFKSLSPVTEYNIYARLIKTKDEFPGKISEPLTVTTDKLTVSAPPKPVCIRNTDTEITLKANGLYEYSIDGENWQKSNVFTGLIHKNTYSLYQRVAETETEYASVPSAPLIMQLVKKTVSAPAAPDYQSHTDNFITVIGNPAYEYSIDGENWQTSATFENLNKNIIYRIYARVAETETEYASAPSKPLVIAIPGKPEILEVGFENILVKYVKGFEYCLDDMVWKNGNSFDMLIDNTEYYVYQRIAAIEGEKVYQITSDYTAVTTDNSKTHTHTFGEWVTDTEKHWHICSDCGEKLNEENHTESDWITDKEALPGIAGERHKECTVCGHVTETEIIPALAAYKPGDINSDGEVDNKDLTRLFQYLSNWDVTVNEAALDVNGDDSVDNKDLTRLFQYLSDWDVEIY